MDLRKISDRGGQWNPTPPFPFTPLLDPVSAEDLEADYWEAMEWIGFTQASVPTDTPENLWFTESDPEWPTHLFVSVGVDPDPGSILRQMIIDQAAEDGVSRAHGAANLVGMDTGVKVTQRFIDWFKEEPDVDLSERVRLCDPPNEDVIGAVFAMPAFIQGRLPDVMRVLFAEKFFIEQQTIQRGQPGGDLEGLPWGWRPEMITQYLAGVGPECITPYGEDGCPDMHEDPEGHSFWEYMAARAVMAFNGIAANGQSADWNCRQLGIHGPLYRVLAGMHTVRSAKRGNDIAGRLAAHSDPLWREIDEWPRPVFAS